MLNPYDKPKTITSLYETDNSVSGEVDFRADLHEMLWTNKRGEYILFRRAAIENGAPKRCECRKDNRSNEPDRDIRCSICDGLGYYYTDYITRAYVNHSSAYSQYVRIKDVGAAKTEYQTIYFEWNFLSQITGNDTDIPNRFDRVYQLKADLAGNLLSPTEIREAYEVLSVDPYRLDNNGRIEYYRFRVTSIVDESFLV